MGSDGKRTIAVTAVTVLTGLILTAAWSAGSGVFINAAMAGEQIPKLTRQVAELKQARGDLNLDLALTKQSLVAMHSQQQQVIDRSERLESKLDRVLELMIQERRQ